MDWLQTLDINLVRFLNSLSNSIYNVVMPWFSRNGLFPSLAGYRRPSALERMARAAGYLYSCCC